MDHDEATHQADGKMLECPSGTQDEARAAALAREPEPEWEPQLPETD